MAREWLEAVCRAYNLPTAALVGRVAEVLRFAAHCPPPTKSRVCSSSMSAKNS